MSECRPQADEFGHPYGLEVYGHRAGSWPGDMSVSILLTLLPKEGVCDGDDTGDFSVVEAYTDSSILYFGRSTDGGSLLLKYGAGLGLWYTFFIFDKDYSLIMNSCVFFFY